MNQFSYEGTQEFLVFCANQFISSFKGRDKFLLPNTSDNRYYSSNYPFPNTAILSEKQNNIYSLCRMYNDIFISTSFIYPFELNKMPSDFWGMIIELDRLGKVNFLPYSANKKIQGKHNKKDSKTAIYNIIKELVLMDEYDSYSIDFGALEVCFKISNLDLSLVDNIIEGLNILHKINYQLYRKNYLNTKKK